MAEDKINAVLAEYGYTVERGKIREFTLSIGDPNPVYTDPQEAQARGYRDVIVPPTFGIVIDLWSGYDYWAQTRAMGMDPFMIIHGEQEYEYYGPIFPGDHISVVSRLVKDETKEGRTGTMRMVRVEHIYTNQHGEKVMVGRSTRIERKPGGARMTEKQLFFDDVKAGEVLPPLVKEAVSRVQLVRYAGASGDFNPLHTETAAGEKAGFGGVIAHGMLIMGFAGQAIANWVPNRCLKRFGVRFVGPTRPGDVVTVSGRVADKKSVGGENLATCEITAADQNGGVKLTGSFDAALPARGASRGQTP